MREILSWSSVSVSEGSPAKGCATRQIYHSTGRECICKRIVFQYIVTAIICLAIPQVPCYGQGAVPEPAARVLNATDTLPPNLAPASAPNGLLDSLSAELDSLPPGLDSIVPPPFAGSTRPYASSPDSLAAAVTYAAQDSMWTDFELQEIHLYGDASVAYEQINLKANHIVLNYGTNIVFAEPLPDSVGRPAGLPEFSDGGQSFTAKEMTYNFKSKKGIVHGTTTTQEDIFVRGGKSKFVSGAIQVDDTTTTDVIYTEGAIFTTCSAEHPHFGIRTRRAKVVPNKLAVIGASNLEIMGVPTPLWLPFGFFPLKSGRSTGLLFPSDYQYSPQLGLGLEGVGWFFPIGEHVNLQTTADIYFNGSFRLRGSTTYRRRYKYNGNFQFTYNRLKQEVNFEPSIDKGITLNWSHRQDQRAHPTFNFGGSINFQTNLVDQRFVNTYEVASQNVIRSSMNVTKQFPRLKSTLTAGLNHSQSNSTREIRVNFPDANFQTQTIYPLRGLPGKQSAWYKKLSMRYRSSLRTEFTNNDEDFFTQQTLDDGQYGFRHDVSSALSFNVLKYFNLSPNVNYAEVYYGKSRAYRLDGEIESEEIVDPVTGEVRIDTTSIGTIQNDLNPGLASFRTFTAGLSLSTQLFGKVKFKRKGLLGLKGLRHVMKPSVTLGYAPDYESGRDYISGTPYYIPTDQIDPLNGQPDRFVSPFDDQIFGRPPSSQERLGLNYSISNLFEAKVWNRKDSTESNVKLFQNIGVSGSYDFTRKDLKWSPVRISGGTRLFKGLTNITLAGTFDPYITRFDEDRKEYRRVNESHLSEGRFPLALQSFTSSVNTNVTVAKIRQLFQGEEEEVVTDIREERRKRRETENTLFEETDILSLFERFSIVHTYRFGFTRTFDTENPSVEDRGRQEFRAVANSISLRGALQLTNNWSVNIGQIGYSFTDKRLTYPFLSFVRDLHCWEMRFSWAPQRKTYSFSVAVKPGTLDFINLPVNQNRYDGGQLFAN